MQAGLRPHIASGSDDGGPDAGYERCGKISHTDGLSIAQNLFFMGFGEATSLALMGLGSASDTSRDFAAGRKQRAGGMGRRGGRGGGGAF